mmetsp:Transcript_14866/g.31889  ORF Transcript_14866/g.31889 Transcript_14866/m.31889 type:complete len:340 (-) Transcript_14866:443-1462(-)
MEATAGGEKMGSQRLGSQRLGSQRLAVGSLRVGSQQGSMRLSSVRLRKMTETVLKEPPLYMTDFGRGDWAMDVLAWPHNALRREMSDMYYLVASMQKRVLDLGHEDIDDFYDWFDIFQMFVQWYFQLEEKLLLPWIEPTTYLAGILDEASRGRLREQLVSRLKDIEECHERFQHLPAGEVLPALISALDKFSPKLLEYFNEQERALPKAIASVYSEEDKNKLDERVLDFVRNSEDNHLIMHLLLRPIKNDAKKSDLRRRYLAAGGFFQKMRFKKTYEKSRKDFREQHADIVKQFYKRWGSAQVAAVEEEDRLAADGGPAGRLMTGQSSKALLDAANGAE